MASVPRHPPAHMASDEQDQHAASHANHTEQKYPLSLPAPTENNAANLDVSTGRAISLDHLGPMVVNSDGTLSRIHNWAEMTDVEKERTLRVIAKRNRLRTEALSNQQQPQ